MYATVTREWQNLLIVAIVLSLLVYGNATLGGLPACLLSLLFLMPQLGRLLVFGTVITSPMLLPVSAGCEHQSTSSLNWWLLSAS